MLTTVNLTARIIPDWPPFSCASCLEQLLQSHPDNCQNNSPESYCPNPYGLLVSQCSQEGRRVNKREKEKRKEGEGKARESGVLLSWCFRSFYRIIPITPKVFSCPIVVLPFNLSPHKALTDLLCHYRFVCIFLIFI